MGLVTSNIAISLDGYVAGPRQSLENPIGEGGMRLHEWMFTTARWRAMEGLDGGEEGPDSDVIDEVMHGVGAYVMGRNMFGGGSGAWEDTWTGWWGDDPPYHAPVFVMTHYPREPLRMTGGTTFNFVTDGVASALEQARVAAGDQNVSVAGGASTIAQVLAAGQLDELYLHLVPIVLGDGEPLLVDVGDPVLEPIKVVAAPRVTHIKYRVVRR